MVAFDPMTNDLINLSPLSTKTVLSCLEERYSSRYFYTFAGSTIIAVNPLCPQPNLYDQQKIQCYHSKEDCDPHIYCTAETSYVSMRCHHRGNQSIIVSGESGAGKTVTASHLIRYLVTVANSDEGRNHQSISISQSGSRIEQRILDSGPILQAFGNAATLRNHNSSRFGKYIQLHFDRLGCVKGASIHTYLLEKTRVVQQNPGECNFHIFYQMLQSDNAELQGWLRSADGIHVGDKLFPEKLNRTHVNYLAIGDKEDNDAEQWKILSSAFATFGLDDSQQLQIFKLLSGLLHLNCVTFDLDPEDEDVCCVSDSSIQFLDQCCHLLGLSDRKAASSFTHRRITASHSRRKSVFHRPCTVTEASARRDCIVKLIYAKLFDWLVDLVNNSMTCSPDNENNIGILDIYGFESFRKNSLEQLCINYANEKLQQHFVSHFLRDLQEEYEKEAIPWTFTEYVDNRPCVEAIDNGIFIILNEECAMNRTVVSDHDIEQRLLCIGSIRRINPKDPGFCVVHYAEPVSYHLEGMLEKNKDNVAAELSELVFESNNPFLSQLFCDLPEHKPGAKKKTVLAKFKHSVDRLMSILHSSQPQYIRCIKPNPASKMGLFDSDYVLAQLKACGVVETVTVSKNAYPDKMTYEEFHQRYSILLRHFQAKSTNSLPSPPNALPGVLSPHNNKASMKPTDEPLSPFPMARTKRMPSVEENKENSFTISSTDDLMLEPFELLYNKPLTPSAGKKRRSTPQRTLRRRAGVSSGDHTRRLCTSIMKVVFGSQYSSSANTHAQFGRTKLFLRDGQLDLLETSRDVVLNHCATTIQCKWKYYQKKKETRAAITIQSVIRSWVQKKKFSSAVDELKSRKNQLANQKSIQESKVSTVQPAKKQPPKTLAKPSKCIQNTKGNEVDRKDTSVPSSQYSSLLDISKSVIKMVKEAFYAGEKVCLEGAFPGIPYLESYRGMLSRRRMPRVTIRFHTKINHVLEFGHVIHRKEVTCSLTDCLEDKY